MELLPNVRLRIKDPFIRIPGLRYTISQLATYYTLYRANTIPC
jgi:hypothetical protein